MNSFPQVPPGFRFHPTDEELVDYYLRRKITCRRMELDVIKDVDLYKIEPWDLQELCRIGREEQNEWYFFSHKDKKYPTGTRTNRATTAGFWKATGRDKSIYSKQTELIGMRKTLVFYKGRAPNGLKSDWIMHEYRLETDENGTSQEEGWVVCKVFKKRIATTRKPNEYDDSNIWYEDHQLPFKDMDFQYGLNIPPNHHHFLHELPNLESPKILHPHDHTTLPSFGLGSSQEYILHQPLDHSMITLTNHEQSSSDQVTDWRVLDKFVASQLSQDIDDTFPATIEQSGPIDMKQETTHENASTSYSSCLWK